MYRRSLISVLSRASLASRACHVKPYSGVSRIAVSRLSTLPNLPLFRALQNHDQSSLAVVHSASSRSFTYGNLVADVLQTKERLLKCAGPQLSGERIAFLVENSYDYVGTVF